MRLYPPLIVLTMPAPGAVYTSYQPLARPLKKLATGLRFLGLGSGADPPLRPPSPPELAVTRPAGHWVVTGSVPSLAQPPPPWGHGSRPLGSARLMGSSPL